jgi:hypothetical protein
VHDGRIERTAQATLAGAHEQEMNPVGTGAGQKPWRPGIVGNRGRDVAEHLLHAFRIGSRCLRRRRRAARFEAATICMALVIFCVALVAAMRTRMSLRLAMDRMTDGG